MNFPEIIINSSYYPTTSRLGFTGGAFQLLSIISLLYVVHFGKETSLLNALFGNNVDCKFARVVTTKYSMYVCLAVVQRGEELFPEVKWPSCLPSRRSTVYCIAAGIHPNPVVNVTRN